MPNSIPSCPEARAALTALTSADDVGVEEGRKYEEVVKVGVVVLNLIDG